MPAAAHPIVHDARHKYTDVHNISVILCYNRYVDINRFAYQYSLSRLMFFGLGPGLTFNVRVDSVTTTMMDDVCMHQAQADGSSVSCISVHHTTQPAFMGWELHTVSLSP